MSYLLFSVCIVCICRFVISAYMRHVYKKKQYIAIQKDALLWDKWFFISVAKGIKDRYSKSEKRIIPYSKHALLFRTINILHHVLLLIEVTLWLVYVVFDDVKLKCIAENMSIFLLGTVGVSFFVLAITTALEHREYHKKRVLRK